MYHNYTFGASNVQQWVQNTGFVFCAGFGNAYIFNTYGHRLHMEDKENAILTLWVSLHIKMLRLVLQSK